MTFYQSRNHLDYRQSRINLGTGHPFHEIYSRWIQHVYSNSSDCNPLVSLFLYPFRIAMRFKSSSNKRLSPVSSVSSLFLTFTTAWGTFHQPGFVVTIAFMRTPLPSPTIGFSLGEDLVNWKAQKIDGAFLLGVPRKWDDGVTYDRSNYNWNKAILQGGRRRRPERAKGREPTDCQLIITSSRSES